MSTLDVPTGLPKFTQFVASLEQLMLNAEGAVTLGVLDVDHFGLVMNELGHFQGDLLLAELGAALRRAVPRSGLLSRWRSNTFVLAVDGADDAVLAGKLQQAAGQVLWRFQTSEIRRLAKQLRDGRRQASGYPSDDSDVTGLTASLVLLRMEQPKATTMTMLFEVADEAMADVKKRGGNDVHIGAVAPDGAGQA